MCKRRHNSVLLAVPNVIYVVLNKHQKVQLIFTLYTHVIMADTSVLLHFQSVTSLSSINFCRCNCVNQKSHFQTSCASKRANQTFSVSNFLKVPLNAASFTACRGRPAANTETLHSLLLQEKQGCGITIFKAAMIDSF